MMSGCIVSDGVNAFLSLPVGNLEIIKDSDSVTCFITSQDLEDAYTWAKERNVNQTFYTQAELIACFKEKTNNSQYRAT